MKDNKHRFVNAAFILVVLLLLPIALVSQSVTYSPVAVSPGNERDVTTIALTCPTFSWSWVSQAASYRLEVFLTTRDQWLPHEEMILISSPLIHKEIAGAALSWTLSVEEQLPPNSIYIWYVQALDENHQPLGPWSNGKIFKIEGQNPISGFEEKLARLLNTYGVEKNISDRIVRDLKTGNPANTKPELDGVKGFEGSGNTFYGLSAGVSTTSSSNSFFGYRAGMSNTTGNYNSFFGTTAGSNNTTGSFNLFAGHLSGYSNTLGVENCALGTRAGYTNTTGGYNSFIGSLAGYSNLSGNRNCFLGYYSGYSNSNGEYNCFIGNESGALNTGGSRNVFLGSLTGGHNTTGTNNVFLGTDAGFNNTTGSGNIFIGYQAGFSEIGANKLFIDNSSTSNPLIYGDMSADTVTVNGKLGINTKNPTYAIEACTTGTNAILAARRTDGATAYINATNAYTSFGSMDNYQVRLLVNGAWKLNLNTDGSLAMASGATCTSGGVWTNASSRVLKENIRALDSSQALQTLTNLTPVTYQYKNDPSDSYVGFIAEDVPELVATADRKGLSPMDITAVLTKVVQEQQAMLQKLQLQNQEYQILLAEIQKRMAQLENQNLHAAD